MLRADAFSAQALGCSRGFRYTEGAVFKRREDADLEWFAKIDLPRRLGTCRELIFARATRFSASLTPHIMPSGALRGHFRLPGAAYRHDLIHARAVLPARYRRRLYTCELITPVGATPQ